MKRLIAATSPRFLVLGLALSVVAQQLPKGTHSGFGSAADGVMIHYVDTDHIQSTDGFRIGGTPHPGALTNGQASISNAPQHPSLLLIPGWTMPEWIWEKQIEHFSKITRVVAMDARAQGESTKTTEGLYPQARAKDIKAVVDQLHLAPVVLVGWSMGVNEVAS